VPVFQAIASSVGCRRLICDANNRNRLRRVRFGLRTTHLRCDKLKHDCNGRVCGAKNTKMVAADQKSPARDEKSRRTMQNTFLRTFSHSFPTQMRCKLYKRSRCALIAVQNNANGLQTHSSQSKRHKMDCNALIAVAIGLNVERLPAGTFNFNVELPFPRTCSLSPFAIPQTRPSIFPISRIGGLPF